MRISAKINGLPFAAGLLLLAAAGCDRDSVKVYKVDNNTAVAVAPPAPASGGSSAMSPDALPAPDNSGLPKLKYALPAGWKEKPLTQWRVASFEISENGKTADASVVPLGGTAGGDLANVNRWRRDVGQGQLAAGDDLKKISEPVTIGGQSADLYDLAGTNTGSGEAERIVAAILYREDTAWFFKMIGDADLVAKNKAAFVAFLKSAEFQNPAAAMPATMNANQLPAGHPAIPATTATPAAATSAADKPTWTVPADWKEGELAQFLVAKFVINSSGGATAAVNVSQLAGDGGGLVANLDRWRGQLGQPPVSDGDAAALPAIDAGGISSRIADFTGTDSRTGKPARLVGVIVPQNGQTWFYKLMGDPDVVMQQKDALIKFVQSAKYPAAQ